jgi:hypothetical protein
MKHASDVAEVLASVVARYGIADSNRKTTKFVNYVDVMSVLISKSDPFDRLFPEIFKGKAKLHVTWEEY